MIDFNIVAPPPSGLVGYAGGAADPLVGTGIKVDSITGTNTPANDGVTLPCPNCFLSFQTGAYNAGLSNTTPLNDWIFDGGDSSFIFVFSDMNGDAQPDPGDTFLMAGRFLGPQITVDLIDDSPGALGISAGLFLDLKNPLLLDAFGLDSQPLFGTLALSWLGAGEPDSAFLGTVLDGRVRNHFAPEPGSTLLLGASLLALAALRRRV
jgi:hypothetical protein